MSPESVSPESPPSPAPESEADRTRRRLRRRAKRLAREELEEALASLEATGPLTEHQRDVVEEMSVAITEAVLAPFEAPLERADGDDEAAAVLSLFDLEE